MRAHRHINHLLFGIFTVLVLAAIALVFILQSRSSGASDILPKDVPYTPAASPLSSPPPAAPLSTSAVSVNPPADNQVGPNTDVSGTAKTAGTVYYRITDFRSGQIAAGEVNTTGNPPVFTFKPSFTRPYTKGDPALLDVYVLDANGSEQTTRLNITLQ